MARPTRLLLGGRWVNDNFFNVMKTNNMLWQKIRSFSFAKIIFFGLLTTCGVAFLAVGVVVACEVVVNPFNDGFDYYRAADWSRFCPFPSTVGGGEVWAYKDRQCACTIFLPCAVTGWGSTCQLENTLKTTCIDAGGNLLNSASCISCTRATLADEVTSLAQCGSSAGTTIPYVCVFGSDGVCPGGGGSCTCDLSQAPGVCEGTNYLDSCGNNVCAGTKGDCSGPICNVSTCLGPNGPFSGTVSATCRVGTNPACPNWLGSITMNSCMSAGTTDACDCCGVCPCDPTTTSITCKNSWFSDTCDNPYQCEGQKICSVENCTNNIDDDGDGAIDCQDSGCPSGLSCGQCQQATCSAVTFDWTCTPKANGTVCNDGNNCTFSDVCTNGACAGTGITCAAPAVCKQAGVCNPATGVCNYANQPNSTGCNDSNSCTINDVCTNGACAGTGITCAAPAVCKQVGVCNPATGTCAYANQANGTGCDDGQYCTINEVCNNGTCQWANRSCTIVNSCLISPGTCNEATDVCDFATRACGVNADGCCPAGCLSFMDSDCNNPPFIPQVVCPFDEATHAGDLPCYPEGSVPIEDLNLPFPNPGPTLTWKPTGGGAPDPNGDPVTYYVFFSDDGGTGFDLETPSGLAGVAGVNSYDYPSKLVLNKTYYWFVVAYDINGALTSSVLWRFKTKANTAPTANITCNPASCSAFANDGIILNANGSSDTEDCPAAYPNAPCNLTCVWAGGGFSGVCSDQLFSPVSPGNYPFTLKTTDTGGLSSPLASKTIVIKQDVFADFRCCSGKPNCAACGANDWKKCETMCDGDGSNCVSNPKIGVDKICYKADPWSKPSQGATISTYNWTFDDGNPAQTGAIVGGWKVTKKLTNITLRVTDNASRWDQVTKILNSAFPPPGWVEK